jgi:hypothetical protein
VTPAEALDRVQKLLQLATKNPSVEEARSAAVKACELIVAHRLIVAVTPQPTAPTTFNAPDWLAQMLRQRQQQQQPAWHQQAQQQAWHDATWVK